VAVVNVSGVDTGVRGRSWGDGAPITAAGAGEGAAEGAAMIPTVERDGLEEVVVV